MTVALPFQVKIRQKWRPLYVARITNPCPTNFSIVVLIRNPGPTCTLRAGYGLYYASWFLLWLYCAGCGWRLLVFFSGAVVVSCLGATSGGRGRYGRANLPVRDTSSGRKFPVSRSLTSLSSPATGPSAASPMPARRSH